MRTMLDLDDRIVEALQARHPGLTRTEAIERALAATWRRMPPRA